MHLGVLQGEGGSADRRRGGAEQGQHGKGGGLKAHDCYIAWACYDCHMELDQGKKLRYDQKCDYWQAGFERTILQMFLLGILKVA